MNVVLDANVLIASVFWNGASCRLMRQALGGRFEIISSEELLAEVRKTLTSPKERFNLSTQEADDITLALRACARIVTPINVHIARDPHDDHVLGCAAAASAETIVTYDKDILVLKEFRGIRIVTPEKFRAQF